MFGLMGQMLGLSWRIFGFAMTMSLFWALIRNGKDTIQDIRDTLIMLIKVGISKLQSWLFKKYKEQCEEPKEKPKEP